MRASTKSRRLPGLLLALAPSVAPGQPAQDALPRFVGEAACLECHAAGRAAAACTLEAIPKHAKTWRVLDFDEADSIAALTGTPEPPHESHLCLGCHSTASDEGPRWREAGLDPAAGVQCEACHGAGSLHAAARRAGAAQEAPPPAGVRRGERADCVQCHRDRASHKEVLERGFRLALQDRLYRTPVNLALAPDGGRLYVACEHSDSVIALDPQSGSVVGEARVGSRPQDVATSPDGRRVYVTNRFSHSVSVLDAQSLAVVREVPVGDDPHGVLVSPSGDRVWVLETGASTIAVLDAGRLEVVRRLAAGNGPWSLAFAPGGDSLVVTSARPQPVPFRAPHASELTVVGLRDEAVVARRTAAGADQLQGAAPIPGQGAVLFTLLRTKNLVPITRLAQGWVVTYGLGVLWADGRVDQVLLDEPGRAFPDVGDVAVSPDGRWAAVSSGGANEVALVDVQRLLATVRAASDRQRAEVLPNQLGLADAFVVARVPVGANPRGLVFSREGREVYVAEALDDTVAVVDVGLRAVTRRFALGGPAEVSEVRAGERLFHDARGTGLRQLSCRTCHPDGHVNGLTFDIEADGLGLHPVDNRTLRGILDTAPFKWEGTNPTLQRQCGPRFAVFFTRQDPFPPRELDALVRYMSTIQRPPNPNRSPQGLSVQQRRGKAVFERDRTNDGDPIPRELRCSTCHDSPYHEAGTAQHVGTSMWFDAPVPVDPIDLTDEGEYGPLGSAYFQDSIRLARNFDTAALANVYAAPPFLHNGAAVSLAEIWTRYNLYQKHGVTHDLTRRQLNDLVAYLRTL